MFRNEINGNKTLVISNDKVSNIMKISIKLEKLERLLKKATKTLAIQVK